MEDEFLKALEAYTPAEEEPKDDFLSALEAYQPEQVDIPQDMRDYAKSLQSQQGSYEVDDLLAAGYTQDQINALEEETQGAFVGTRTGTSDAIIKPSAPSTDMYDGYRLGRVDDDVSETEDVTAYGIYNSYINSENTSQNAIGEYIYTDPDTNRMYRIPKPEISGTVSGTLSFDEYLVDEDARANAPAGVSLATLALDGVRDSTINTAEVVAALGDLTIDKLFDTDTDMTEFVQDNFATTSTGFSKSDALVKEGIGMAVGFFTGQGIAKGGIRIGGSILSNLSDVKVIGSVMKEVAPATNRLLQFDVEKLAGAIGSEVGAVATVDSDTQALLFGENGLLGYDAIELFGVTAGDDAAEQVLAARMNILTDAALGAGLFTPAAKGLTDLAKFVSEVSVGGIVMRLVGDEASAKQRAVQAILDDLASVEAVSTAEDMAVVRDRLVRLIEENKEVLLEPDDAAPVVFDALTALERSGEVSPETLVRLRQLRSGQITQPGGEALVVAMGQPARAVDEKLGTLADEAYTAGNNAQNVADTVVELSQTRLADVDARIADLNTAIQNADAQAVRDILSDSRFGPVVEKLTNVSPSQLTSMSEEALIRVARGAVDEINALNRTKNELFAAIPKGVEFDYAGFAESVGLATRDLNAFDDTGRTLLGTRLISAIKQGYEDAGGIGLKELDDLTVDDLADLSGMMLEAGVDFNTLYTKIRPRISALADEAFANGQNEVGRRLADVRRSIDEQVEWVAQNADAEAADAANAAMDFYKNDFAPLLRDDPLESLDTTVQANTRVDAQGNPTEMKPVRIVNVSEATTQNIMEQGTRNDMNQLLRLLGGDASEVSAQDVEEYITANIFQNLFQTIRQNGLENLTDAEVSSLVQQYGVQLRALGPDSLLASQLDTFTSRILAARKNTAALEAELTAAEEALQSLQSDAFANLVQKFTNSAVDGLEATANPQATLQAFVYGPKGADNVTALLRATDNNPIVREGLENAFFKRLQDGMLSTVETIDGAPTIKPGAVRRLMDEEGNMAMVADVLFADKPDTRALVDTLIGVLDDAGSGRNARSIPGMSGTAELQAYQGAVNRLIYLTVGALNKTGTRIRSFSNFAADKLDLAGTYQQAVSSILSDADAFAAIARKIVDREGTVGIGKIRMDKELAEEFFNLGVRVGLYAQSDEDRQDAYSLWDSAFDAEIAVRDAVGSAAGQVEDWLR